MFNPPGFLQCTCLNVKLWTYYTWGSKFNNNKTWWLPASKLLPLVSANKINCYCSKHQLLNLFFHRQFTLIISIYKPIIVFVFSVFTVPSTLCLYWVTLSVFQIFCQAQRNKGFQASHSSWSGSRCRLPGKMIWTINLPIQQKTKMYWRMHLMH